MLARGLDPYADSAGLTDTGSSADLDGLLTRIRSFDLEVGFAIDLELVEADPATARDHPDWLLTVERDGVTRQVLDLSVHPAMVHVWERLTKLLDRHHVVAELVAATRCTPAGATPTQQKHAGCVPAARCAA